MKFEPVIKWSGSKRSQSEYIVNKIKSIKNREGGTYYEPFCGGASMLMQVLLNNDELKFEKFVCSDMNSDLIALFQEIKVNPDRVADEYEALWNELNKDDDLERKKNYFAEIRERFNRHKSPYDFMFIMRTTTNGMPRYNKNGQFNNSFHITRNGIIPATLRKIIKNWSDTLCRFDVQFLHSDYRKQLEKSTVNDIVYLDPPYANTKGMYYGGINLSTLWESLRCCRATYILSFDGKTNHVDLTHDIPRDTYDSHEYVLNGNSAFRRVIGTSNDSCVSESLYTKIKN